MISGIAGTLSIHPKLQNKVFLKLEIFNLDRRLFDYPWKMDAFENFKFSKGLKKKRLKFFLKNWNYSTWKIILGSSPHPTGRWGVGPPSTHCGTSALVDRKIGPLKYREWRGWSDPETHPSSTTTGGRVGRGPPPTLHQVCGTLVPPWVAGTKVAYAWRHPPKSQRVSERGERRSSHMQAWPLLRNGILSDD